MLVLSLEGLALFVAAACMVDPSPQRSRALGLTAAAQQPTSPIRTPSASAGLASPLFKGGQRGVGSRAVSASAGPWCENPFSHPSSPDGVQPFAEGVRIDWPKLTVEVDAEVVLRQGPLELFACNPRTKEHESILVVPARPLHIFQALGLIGLTPGKPLRFDEETKRWEEPRGDRVELRVRYTDERGTHVVASEQWVADAKGRNSDRPIALDWIFTGSMNQPDGRFAADADGTIACLVDFESALIALGSRHSADNEQLWLVANTAQIPPRGTKCVLLIRSNKRPAVEVDMLDDQTVRVGERSLGPEQLADMLAPPSDDPRPAHLMILQGPNVSDEAVKAFLDRLRKHRPFDGQIETKRRP